MKVYITQVLAQRLLAMALKQVNKGSCTERVKPCNMVYYKELDSLTLTPNISLDFL